ncbi:YcjF family protein [Qingshengfaniella alkalisoli]|uniref:TIGR01620 family protein n=1 Tax=Qingshengfaniella alkalisoli TaxID=2599296 RepID=A0A5B8IVA5_9RHOB|nr:TIGR01620 family protein [Qingshengfaniella alkalisoli]QDY69544.1 TIGR01620 family protein [Qingshengfaniella alkalisoli]
MTDTRKGPVLFDVEEDELQQTPGDAPPVPDEGIPGGDAAAMQRLAMLASRRGSVLARWFWGLLGAVVLFLATTALWAWVGALLASNPVLGGIATVLLVAFALVCLVLVIKELSAFARLARLDKVHAQATEALADHDLAASRKIAERLQQFYRHRPELRWETEDMESRLSDSFDADATLALAETHLLIPLDAQARREVEAAARQVAAVTALVPLAFADVFAALTSNMRMIRRIAEIYGGRSGTLGTWRLTRAVLTHLVATGAVAVGDDLIGSVAGGSVLSRVSRRFGEGVVNGALTARVGVAAIEVCRPLPFIRSERPRVTSLVKRALTGLFPTGD